MFENLRQSLRDLASGAVPQAQRAAAVAHMRATLVQAKVGVADMAAALEKTRNSLRVEEAELLTVRRRKVQAEQINDVETIAVAQRFEQKHLERVEVLSRKIAAQEDELRLAESEVAVMITELKAVAAGVGSGLTPDAVSREVDEALDDAEDLERDLDGLARQKAREAKEAHAEDRLAELKRRMGK